MKKVSWFDLCVKLSLLGICGIGIVVVLFFVSLFYAEFVYSLIQIGQMESEVNVVCGFGSRHEVSLNETEWLKNSKIPSSYDKIVVYNVCFFLPIEVMFSEQAGVIWKLPAYE